MNQQQQSVMLADTFPAKAYLLVTHLTETDPQVSSFASDGSSFEIYDQSIFAQKYLPQYFKHSNYGSFVRQLNLYGFTSSRLKENNDVVVWTHAFFHRDRKDMVKEIKRTKKTKSAKPSHVHINNPRSPSPPSLSDDISSDNTTNPAKISSNGSRLDHGWLESEFASLRKQNRFLEQKLDTLLQLTLRISPVSLEEVQVGEKRRRMSPVESGEDVHYKLESIHEEQKSFDDLNCGTAYEGGRKVPPHVATDAGDHEFPGRDDSLKRFVDIMLNEDDKEESKAGGGYEQENNPSSGLNASLQEPITEDALDDELMEEAMNAFLPDDEIDTEGDLFGSSDDADESPAQLAPNNGMVTITNAAMHKVDPEPIHTISPDIPAVQSRDIEEGNIPEGVAVIEEDNMPEGVPVISARAELVQDIQHVDSNVSNEPAEQILIRDRRDRRKIIYLLAFIGAVLAGGVAWMAVVLSKDDTEDTKSGKLKKPVVLLPCPGGYRRGKHGGPCTSRFSASEDMSQPEYSEDMFQPEYSEDQPPWGVWDKDEADGDQVGNMANDPDQQEEDQEEDQDEDQKEDQEGVEEEFDSLQNGTPQVFRSHSNVMYRTRAKEIKSVLDGTSSFSLQLGGTGFRCSREDVFN